ncbi:MAG TPA: mechanosensitive ion channel protein MscS [Cryomorphaceae bacterium]|nr:mechanosensitive ion channel protein MscS [Owenweeksia sp.]HBF20013.1 mechanosensitive ion channel protein MscS [Cryomorphaceae bacterium]|tara:strand:+ start:1223 stop:2179 length:957 start_codon:yes stop_codon:yes gene_type:complete
MKSLASIDFGINKAYDLLTEKMETWLELAVKMLPNLVISIIILLVFAGIGKLLKKVVYRLTGKITDNLSLRKLISSILYIIILALGTFIALSVLELDGAVTSLLAGAGVIGLALGFAFQDIASNFIAGTMMSIRRPFQVNDLIETNDFFGKVVSIHLRTTQIETLQGQLVMIPNAEVFKKPIINYSVLGKRRIDLEVGVTYGQDLPFAKKVAKEAVEKIEGIQGDVTIFYTEFGDSSINFTIRYWMTFTNKQFEYRDMVDKGIIAIKQAFDENGISIPFPIRTLDFGDVNFKDIFKTYSNTLGGSSGKADDASGDSNE